MRGTKGTQLAVSGIQPQNLNSMDVNEVHESKHI